MPQSEKVSSFYLDGTKYELNGGGVAEGISTTQPSNPVEGSIYYDTTNDVLKTYDGTQWNEVSGGVEYTAGDNIIIDEDNEISAIDTTYNAGPGIEIGTNNNYSAMQGPCQDGFHIPNEDDILNLYILLSNIGDIYTELYGGNLNEVYELNIPPVGFVYYDGVLSPNRTDRGTMSYTWVSDGGGYQCAEWNNSSLAVYTHSPNDLCPMQAMPIRAFKDKYVTPDSSRTTDVDMTQDAKDYEEEEGDTGRSFDYPIGIFHNSTLGIITFSDGTTCMTIADKNLGATTTWNDGDNLTTDNCGNIYQWGNCYGFTSAEYGTTGYYEGQKDASNYGPGNYYSSSEFVYPDDGSEQGLPVGKWDSSDNQNLRGGETGVITTEDAITNIGVLSVNGQTGDVTVASPDMSNYLAKDNTTAFIPSGDYNPATKKYVDDLHKIISVSAINNTTASTIGSAINMYGAENILVVRSNYQGGDFYRLYDTRSYYDGGVITNYHFRSIGTPTETQNYNVVPTFQDKLLSFSLCFNEDNNTRYVDYTSDYDLKYIGGKGIEILNGPDYYDVQGPSPVGFHIPISKEREKVIKGGIEMGARPEGNPYSGESGTNRGNTISTYLKIPFTDYRDGSTGSVTSSSNGGYRCAEEASINSQDPNYRFVNVFAIGSDSVVYNANTNRGAQGNSIRCFKNIPEVPDSTWTTIFDGSNYIKGAGIFYNSTKGLISISKDGYNWITMADKNLGATTVYNFGDTKSEANCGKLYQRGNNYGFPYSGSVSTQTTKIDGNLYGPGNYYYSNKFIISYDSIMSSSGRNPNIWGGTSGGTDNVNMIRNVGVLSGDEGVIYKIKVSNSAPASGTSDNIITFVI